MSLKNPLHDEKKQFTRRAILLGIAQGIGFAALAGRLFQLQIHENDKYRKLSYDNSTTGVLIPPIRGQIIDKHGVVLAGSKPNYRFVLLPKRTKNFSLSNILGKVHKFLPELTINKREIIRRLNHSGHYIPVPILDNLSWRDFARINVLNDEFPECEPDVDVIRFYPFAESFSHVLGYVRTPSTRDVTEDRAYQNLAYFPDYKVGAIDIEQTFNSALRGSPGSKEIEINAHGYPVRTLAITPPTRGKTIQISLDARIQNFAYHRLNGFAASCVVIDLRLGSVIACVSVPGFDSNLLSKTVSHEQWESMLTNSYRPLLNKSLSGLYPPGSTLKPVVALAALKSGIDPYQSVFCTGKYIVGHHVFHCWKHYGHGAVNMIQAIEQSCDIYFYTRAREIGIDIIAESGKTFGLGEVCPIAIGSQASGVMPNRAWKKRTIGTRWQVGDTIVAGIGQGYVLATPFQLAIMISRLATGNMHFCPHVYNNYNNGASFLKSSPSLLNFSSEELSIVRKGMWGAVNNPHGTAYRHRVRHQLWTMAGKTGTSQVKKITQKERESRVNLDSTKVSYAQRDHALFVGYAPFKNPLFAVATVIEHGGGHNAQAIPATHDILVYILKNMQL